MMSDTGAPDRCLYVGHQDPRVHLRACVERAVQTLRATGSAPLAMTGLASDFAKHAATETLELEPVLAWLAEVGPDQISVDDMERLIVQIGST